MVWDTGKPGMRPAIDQGRVGAHGRMEAMTSLLQTRVVIEYMEGFGRVARDVTFHVDFAAVDGVVGAEGIISISVDFVAIKD